VFHSTHDTNVRPTSRDQATRARVPPGQTRSKAEYSPAHSPDPRNEPGQIVAGMSDYARGRLIALLGEVFNVLDNLDVVCPMYVPPCEAYLRFNELRELLRTLNNEDHAGPAAPSDEHSDSFRSNVDASDGPARCSSPESYSGPLARPPIEGDWEV